MQTGGVLDIPDQAIASADLPATMSDTTVFSNATGKAYLLTLVVKAGGTVELPVDSVSIDALNGITVTAASLNNAGNGSTATLTPTLVSNATAKAYVLTLEVAAGGTVTVPADSVSIDAVNGITVTAAAINDAGNGATATLTPTLVSNATGKIYMQTLEVPSGGTVELPAASIASDDLPTSMTDTTIFSNDAAVVYAANGTFTNGLVVDARAPVLSFNTATYVTEVGTITMGSNGKYTNDWTTAFSAAPIVVLTYGEAVSTNTAFTTLLSTTSGVFNGTASVLMNFNATGLK